MTPSDGGVLPDIDALQAAGARQRAREQDIAAIIAAKAAARELVMDLLATAITGASGVPIPPGLVDLIADKVVDNTIRVLAGDD